MANKYIGQKIVAPKPEGMEHMSWDAIADALGQPKHLVWERAKAGTLQDLLPLTISRRQELLSYR
jgi:hypothetical protein